MEVSRSGTSVSAVIPAYNSARCVGDAIYSVLAQTYEIAEIIVVDDGSSDRTGDVAAGFPRTRVIRRANGGPGAARNSGVQAASGEWIAFLDSDDVWIPQKTELQLKRITAQTGVVHCNRFDPIHFGNLWHRQTHISPSGALVRKQAVIDAGGFEESRAVTSVEDLNLWLKIALTDWRFAQSEIGLFHYRPTSDSLSANDLRMSRAELANVKIVGSLVSCQPAEVARINQASRIEYAKNLFAGKRWDEAAMLLEECTPGLAQRWLSLARFLKVNRLARTNLVRWLQSIDGQYKSHSCSGECSLSDTQRRQCMESCHKPYFRSSGPG
jgi:glycosyltransferase involved in cell wall biosynthesis